MKKVLYILLLLSFSFGFAQTDEQRIQNIKNQLTALSVDNVGLTENVKTEISVNNITLSNFLLAVSDVHKVNINVAPELSQTSIANNFTNVTVADLLVFLCKEYSLTIDFTGNILSIKAYQKPVEQVEQKEIPITYNPSNNNISIDAKNDKLYDVFKLIMDKTGKNLVFSPGLENHSLTAYIQNVPFDAAMDKLSLANNLYVEQSKDGFYIFESDTTSLASTENNQTQQPSKRPNRRRNSNFFFKVLDTETKTLEVDFVNTSIADIINDIGNELKIDVFTATPLDNVGTATFKTKSITFDELLVKIFESQVKSNVASTSGNSQNQNNQRTPSNNATTSEIFTFKKEGNTYFFGTEKQLSVRKIEMITLQYRSVELLSDPSGGGSRSQNFGGNSGYNNTNFGGSNSSFNNNSFNSNRNSNSNQNTIRNTSSNPNPNRNRNRNSGQSQNQSITDLIPDELLEGIEYKTDVELNSFYVSGPGAKIERFKQFLAQIDKPVPVVLIEVMIIEVSKNARIETGVTWGIGDEPSTTTGGIFPTTDLTLGAQTINKIIGGFNDFGSFNIGKVVPNFFATIKAMEENGDLKIRSTPKLATLNGHKATFSNGETTYYAVTQRNIYGTDNPQSSEYTNYFPIDVELGLTIKPSVSGNGQVLLDINVIQSGFGDRIAEDAPPNITSREFNSIIRMQDQDIAILGGLEEQVKENRGTGVPFLSKIPIIKWLFSSRSRNASKAKLTVLIKPTVIY